MVEVGGYYEWKDGEWIVRLEDTEMGKTWFSCKTQYEAEVLGCLVRIEKLLREKK